MNSLHFRAPLGILLALTYLTSLAQSPAASPMTEVEAAVDSAVQKTISERHLAGVQVAVVRDGNVAFVKGYGIDRLSPERKVDPTRSLFRIGSISKTFIWIALLQLEDRELLKLSDPVNDHLPAALKIPDEGFEQPIRILDLMNHTAGFEDNLQGLFVDPAEMPLSLTEQLQRYRPHRVREPGLFSYSNYGAALAGAIVAYRSGMEYERYVEEKIFQPLGMTHTTLREEYAASPNLPAPMAAELAADKAVALEWRDKAWIEFPQEHLAQMAPAGSGVSTASDLAIYMNALLHPERLERAGILQQATFAKLKAPSFQGAPGMPGMHHGFFNAALGKSSILEVDNLAHTGSTLHFFSVMVLIPELARQPAYVEPSAIPNTAPTVEGATGTLGIFITTNGQQGRELLETLPQLIVSKLAAPNPIRRPSPPADFKARASEYVGSYSQLRRSFTTAEKLRALTQMTNVSATAEGFLQLGSGPQAIRGVEVAKDLFKQIDGDATFAFKRDAKGSISHVVVLVGAFQYTADRIGFFRTTQWFGVIHVLALVTTLGVLIGSARRLMKKKSESSAADRFAALSMTIAALAWSGFIAAFVSFFIQLSDVVGQDQILMHFPSTALKAVMIFALTGTMAGLVALIARIPGLSNSAWTPWRKVRHIAAALIFIALALTLNDLNLIGFKYY